MAKTFKSVATAGIAAALLGLSMSASAALVGTWVSNTTVGNGTGSASIDTSVINAVTLTANNTANDPDNQGGQGARVVATYTRDAGTAASYDFSWTYQGTTGEDLSSPANQAAGYFYGSLDNLTYVDATAGVGQMGAPWNGSFHVDLLATDVFGFFIVGFDSAAGGTSTFSITQREGETNVPEPDMLALMGLAMLGLVAVRRRSAR